MCDDFQIQQDKAWVRSWILASITVLSYMFIFIMLQCLNAQWKGCKQELTAVPIKGFLRSPHLSCYLFPLILQFPLFCCCCCCFWVFLFPHPWPPELAEGQGEKGSATLYLDNIKSEKLWHLPSQNWQSQLKKTKCSCSKLPTFLVCRKRSRVAPGYAEPA